MSNKIRSAVICLVACVWTANFVAPIFVKGYVPAAEVHVVFMTVIAALGFGYRHKTGEPPETDKQPDK